MDSACRPSGIGTWMDAGDRRRNCQMPLDMPKIPAAGDRFDTRTNAAHPSQEGSYRIRTLLMMQLREMRRLRGLNQVQAARWFGVSQPRISHLAHNRTDRFTTDTLINMLETAGTRIRVTFESSLDDPVARVTTVAHIRGRGVQAENLSHSAAIKADDC